jgi:hypothetical protein
MRCSSLYFEALDCRGKQKLETFSDQALNEAICGPRIFSKEGFSVSAASGILFIRRVRSIRVQYLNLSK